MSNPQLHLYTINTVLPSSNKFSGLFKCVLSFINCKFSFICGYIDMYEIEPTFLKYILVPCASCAFSYPLSTMAHLMYMRHKTQKDQVRPLCKETLLKKTGLRFQFRLDSKGPVLSTIPWEPVSTDFLTS